MLLLVIVIGVMMTDDDDDGVVAGKWFENGRTMEETPGREYQCC